MSARYLARAVDGQAVLGDGEGYVPLASVAPSLGSVADAVRVAPDGLPL